MMNTQTPNSLLLIDGGASLLQITKQRLISANFKVTMASDRLQGYQVALTDNFDVIILCTAKSILNGLFICKKLRSDGVTAPIIMLAPRSNRISAVQSLQYGADDYLSIPFQFEELIARINALIRRNARLFNADSIIKNGLSLNVNSGVLSFEERITSLTRTEGSLLYFIMLQDPRMITRAALLNSVWGIEKSHTSNRLDVYVKRVRSKLLSIRCPLMIKTIHGLGYRLTYPI